MFNISAQDVLNPRPYQGNAPSSLDLVHQISQAVTGFKGHAMDETGAHINYQKLRQSESYQSYTQELAPQLQTLQFEDLTERKTATAFWINLYNALVIHAVIEFGIQESINENGFGGQVRFFRQAAYNIGGMRFSLEDIEHGVLRANRGNPFQFSPQIPPNDPRHLCVITPMDARIHFALNCASVSCPPIRAYDVKNLDAQLEVASKNFIQQETMVKDSVLYISKLFSWYKKDFGSSTNIAEFIIRYLPDGKRKDWLIANCQNPDFHYLPYNWNLNI